MAILFLLLFVTGYDTPTGQSVEIPLLMPKISPLVEDSTLCTAIQIPDQETFYITRVSLNVSEKLAHHVLVYGCSRPGYLSPDDPQAVWNCAHTADTEVDHRFPRHKKDCQDGEPDTLMFNYAHGGHDLIMPEGVGFRVGAGTRIAYLVLEVHYYDVAQFPAGATDQTGVIMEMLPRSAESFRGTVGYLLLDDGGGFLPAHQVEHFEGACRLNDSTPVHLFSFFGHTHDLGTVVSAWKIDGKTNKWSLIQRSDPQLHAGHLPVINGEVVLEEGDYIAHRCTFNNTRDHGVSYGLTADDEMCLVHGLYFQEEDDVAPMIECTTAGPPNYYWNSDPNIQPVPEWVDREASLLD